MTIQGIDISHYQGKPDFDLLKSQVSFVIIKATEGTTGKDSEFSRNQSETRRVGMALGYYHFARPDFNTPEKEADYFLSIVKPNPGEVLCLDFETAAPNPPAWCKSFLDRVSEKLGGYKCLIYLNRSLANGNDWSAVIAGNYGLWLASYDGSQTSIPKHPWPTMAMKQWSSSGKLNGISGSIDMDTFFGDVNTFIKYGYSGGTMTDMYNGQDLDNKAAMKICVDDHNAIQSGVYIKKTDADAQVKSAHDTGYSEGVKSVPQGGGGSSVDLSKYKENGVQVETTVGNIKTIVNYALK